MHNDQVHIGQIQQLQISFKIFLSSSVAIEDVLHGWIQATPRHFGFNKNLLTRKRGICNGLANTVLTARWRFGLWHACRIRENQRKTSRLAFQTTVTRLMMQRYILIGLVSISFAHPTHRRLYQILIVVVQRGVNHGESCVESSRDGTIRCRAVVPWKSVSNRQWFRHEVSIQSFGILGSCKWSTICKTW